jgi:hypothetical protein
MSPYAYKDFQQTCLVHNISSAFSIALHCQKHCRRPLFWQNTEFLKQTTKFQKQTSKFLKQTVRHSLQAEVLEIHAKYLNNHIWALFTKHQNIYISPTYETTVTVRNVIFLTFLVKTVLRQAVNALKTFITLLFAFLKHGSILFKVSGNKVFHSTCIVSPKHLYT